MILRTQETYRSLCTDLETEVREGTVPKVVALLGTDSVPLPNSSSFISSKHPSPEQIECRPNQTPHQSGLGGVKPKMIAGKGRDWHFPSAWNLPDVSGRCFVHFVSCKPPKGSVKKGTFIFQGEGSQGSWKMSNLLRVAKRERHRSEVDFEGVSCSPAHADPAPRALPAWLTPRGA